MGSLLESVDILDLRQYGSAQLRPLLSRESEVWASTMSWDYRSSAEMILRYIDAKILPGYAAIENGQIVGYAFFIYEGSKGVIGDVFVSEGDPSEGGHAREGSIRERLLTHVIETLQNTPGIHRIEAQLLVHESGDATGPFLSEGFLAHPRLFMELPMAKIAESGPVVPLDIELRKWTEADFQPAASVITQSYFGHIDSDINDQYRTHAGAMRFLNNIVRFPGCGIFEGSASFVAVDRLSGAMVGLLLCSRVRDDVGHVTQICMLPQQRGRRLGEALILACARDLKKRGFHDLTLTVTEANTRAVDLYKRLGFQTMKVFDAFVWEG